MIRPDLQGPGGTGTDARRQRSGMRQRGLSVSFRAAYPGQIPDAEALGRIDLIPGSLPTRSEKYWHRGSLSRNDSPWEEGHLLLRSLWCWV